MKVFNVLRLKILLVCFLAALSAFLLVSPMAQAVQRVAGHGEIVLLALGDSLTEGYGVPPEEAYPAELERLLRAEGFKVEVRNHGHSGSTSSSVFSRLKWALDRAPRPQIVILAIGANDALRGLSLKRVAANLERCIELLQSVKIDIVLAGLQIPDNYGAEYAKNFAALYRSLAKKHKITFVPFLLEGVAGVEKLNLRDKIHPNAKGYKIVAANVFRHVVQLVKQHARRKNGSTSQSLPASDGRNPSDKRHRP